MKKLLFLFAFLTLLLWPQDAWLQQTTVGYFVQANCDTINFRRDNAVICIQTEAQSGRAVGEYRWTGQGWLKSDGAYVGTVAPSTCKVGETFFKTDATPGQNLYACTAEPGTWTLQSGAGTSGHIIQEEGTDLPTQPKLNCAGNGITCTNNAANNRIDINVAGGPIDVTDNYAWTGLNSWRDQNWSLVDQGDTTKVLKFQLAGIPTGTTFTLVPPNANTTLLGLSDVGTTVQGVLTNSAGLRAALSDETGTGAAVFADSPTLTTPAIGSFANAPHTHADAAGGGQITDAALSAPVGIAKGGTGSTTAAGARTGLAVPGLADANTFTGANAFDSGIAFTSDVEPAQITADQNNYAGCTVATRAVCRTTSNAQWNITGLAGGADGITLFFFNKGGNNLILANESGSSTAGNRLAIGANTTIGPNQGVILQYDAVSLRWRMASGVSGGGGGGQPSDADLTALAALVGTGFAARTAADTWAVRSFADGTGITWTNPAGIAGNPTAALATTHNCIVNSATGQVLFNNGGTCDGISTVLIDPATGIITAAGFTGPVTGNVTSSGQSTFTGSLLVPGKADPGSPITNELWRSTTAPLGIKYYDGTTTHRDLRDVDFPSAGFMMRGATTGIYSILAPTDDSLAIGNGTVWQNKVLTTCRPSLGQGWSYDAATNTLGCEAVVAGSATLPSVTEDANSVNIAKATEVGLSPFVNFVRGAGITADRNYTLARDVAGDVALTTGTPTSAALTKFDASGRLVPAGPSFKVHQFLIGAENGTALIDGDDQPSIFYNHWGQGVTITEVWCESDAGSPTINLQRDDGSPANILSASLTCTTGGATSTSFSGTENQIASTNRVDFVMVAAGGTAKRITVSFRYTMD